MPREIPWTGWKDILARVWKQIDDDHVGIVAGGVAFYAAISIFPLVALSVALYGVFASPEVVESHLGLVWEQLPPSAARIVSDYVHELTEASASSLSFGLVVSLVLTLYTGSKGIDTLLEGVHIAYDEGRTRAIWKQKLLAIALTIVSLIGGLLSLAMVAGLPWLFEIMHLGGFGRVVAEILRWVALAVVVMVGLACLYRYAPARERAKWRWLTPGAILATLLWLVGSSAFSYYASKWGSYDATYGAFGGLFVLLLWLYLSAYIVLIGAEVNAEVEAQTAVDTTDGEPVPMGERGAVKADTLGPARKPKAPKTPKTSD